MWIIVFLGSFLVSTILGQSCDYVGEIGATPLTIESPLYPNKYKTNSFCTWTTSTYAAYQLKLTCSIFQVPSVIDDLTGDLLHICPGDYLAVSRTGNAKDEVKYCGSQAFTVTSVSNKMNIRFNTWPLTRGGKFSCILERIPNPCECGRRKDTRIVDGTTAGVDKYPWVGSLVDRESETTYCGATVITTRIALTAKSCLTDRSLVKIGLFVSLYDTKKPTNYTTAYDIKNITCYNGCINNGISQTDIDVGLVITKQEIELNVGVALACLPYAFKFDSFTGSKVEVAGYGVQEFGGSIPRKLQEVQLDVISQRSCKDNYNGLTDDQMCTYTPGKGLCLMDDGNGLFYTSAVNGRVYVIGVATQYLYCASPAPDISTRVTSTLKWIKDNTQKFDYCKN